MIGSKIKELKKLIIEDKNKEAYELICKLDIIYKIVEIPTKVVENPFTKMDKSWLEFFVANKELVLMFDGIMKKVLETKFVPDRNQIFNAFNYCEKSKIKVVILGQDPYYNGSAHGLAFSCLNDIPRSLVNIYKCLIENKIISTMPRTGNLEKWAGQGILLLNTALTTEVGRAGQHIELWRNFSIKIIQEISKDDKLIWCLWGAKAKEYKSYISSGTILEYAHPSPMSKVDFSKCKHFNIIKEKYTDIDFNP